MITLFFLIQVAFSFELAINDFRFEPIDTQFQQLQSIHKTPCVQTAIVSLILECKEKGVDLVDPEIRTILAVKLSICEFEETGVAYPDSCRSPPTVNNYKTCIQEFRANPQLWTTYSGNYRKLRSICFEESFPFMKDHVIDLFYNITKIYSDLYHETTNATKKAKIFHDDVERRFMLLLELLSATFEQKQKHQGDMEQAFEDFETSMTSGYTEVKAKLGLTTDEILKNFSQFKDQINSVNQVVMQMMSRYSVMDLQLAEREERLFKKHGEVSFGILHDLSQIRQFTQDSTEDSLVLNDKLANNIRIGDQLGHTLEGAADQMEEWVSSMDHTVHILYDELVQRLISKSDGVIAVFEQQLQVIINGTDDFKDQLQTHLANVTDAIIKVETQISTLSFPLIFQGFLGPIKDIKTQLFFSLKIVAIAVVIAIIGALKLHQVIRTYLTFLLAMIPGFVAAFCFRAVLAAYWS